MTSRAAGNAIGNAARVVAAIAALAGSSAQAAGNEAHLVHDEVRLVLSPEGRAEVTHAEQWHVASGALRTLDVVGLEEHAELRPDVVVEGADGSRSTAHVAWFAPRVARVTLDDPRGLRRGDYHLELGYQVDLLASHELVADGAMWRLAWTAPSATEGLDGQTVSFDLPAAPTAPRADMGGATGDDGIVASVERGAERDHLQLVRPHVARGEAVTWAVRLDPRALAHVAPLASPGADRLDAAAAGPSPTERTWRAALEGLALAAVAALYGAVAARRRGRGLVPVAPRWRGIGTAVSLGLGLALQTAGSMTSGALALAACLALATLAPSPRPETIRGPGTWTSVAPRAAFGRPPRARLEVRRWLAALAAVVVILLAVLGASLPALSRAMAIGALDLLVLVPLLVGGGIAPTAFARSRRPLARAFRALSRRDPRAGELTVTPWARTPAGRSEPEELRLRLEPRQGIAGTVSVELGLVSTPGAAPRPEVLVRVRASSAAGARIAALAPWAASLPGLTRDERVVRLSPRFPSLRLARKLALRVALALTDRRGPHPASPRPGRAKVWTGPNRRAAAVSAEASPLLPGVAPARRTPPPGAVDASALLLR